MQAESKVVASCTAPATYHFKGARNIVNIARSNSKLLQLSYSVYSSALVAADSPLDGMTRIDDGCSPDSLISKSFAASLAAASLLSRSESALSTLHSSQGKSDVFLCWPAETSDWVAVL